MVKREISSWGRRGGWLERGLAMLCWLGAHGCVGQLVWILVE